MAKVKLTHLYCLDDHRNQSEEIKKRFSDTSKYRIGFYFSKDEFIEHFRKRLEPNNCKIAVITVPETKEQIGKFNDLTIELKKIDPDCGIILLVPLSIEEEIRKTILYNIDVYIPVSQNSVLRIHNAVKKIISEYNIAINKRIRNISVYFLLAFLGLAATGLLILYLKFPSLF